VGYKGNIKEKKYLNKVKKKEVKRGKRKIENHA
jgi:hypothetical protein